MPGGAEIIAARSSGWLCIGAGGAVVSSLVVEDQD